MMGTEQFHFRERHQKLSQKMPLALSLSHLFTPLQFISFSLSLSPSVSPSFSLSQSLSPSLTSLLPSLLHFTVFASSPKAFFLQIFSMKSEKGKRVGRKETCYENKTFFASLTFFLPEVKKKIWSVKKSLCISRDSLSHSLSFHFQFKISVWIFFILKVLSYIVKNTFLLDLWYFLSVSTQIHNRLANLTHNLTKITSPLWLS